MRRTVKPTTFSNKHGIAHTPIDQVPLLNACYGIWNNAFLRTLSQGIAIYPVVTHNVTHAIILNSLSEWLTTGKVDVELMAGTMHELGQSNLPPNTKKQSMLQAKWTTSSNPSLRSSSQLFKSEISNSLKPNQRRSKAFNTKSTSTHKKHPSLQASTQAMHLPQSHRRKKPKLLSSQQKDRNLTIATSGNPPLWTDHSPATCQNHPSPTTSARGLVKSKETYQTIQTTNNSKPTSQPRKSLQGN